MPTTNSTITLADVLNAVNSNLPTLAHGKSYTLEQLVGEDYWNTIPKGHRNKLGQAFKALATSGTLSVAYVGSTSGNKSLYELK